MSLKSCTLFENYLKTSTLHLHLASAPLRGNDVPTYMDNTRSLPYPVGDQCNTTTSAHLPYQQQNINNDRLPYPLNHSTVNLQY